MKFGKQRLALLLAGTMAFGLLAGCGGDTGASGDASSAGGANGGAAEDAYVVGIVQLAEHNALDEATRGFRDYLTEKLGDKVVFDFQNAQGEAPNCTTIVSKFVNDGVDLIMANATPAAQAASAATGEIPIVGTSITDYVATGLADTNEAPGRNITGVSDLCPIDRHVTLMGELCPDVQKVGVVYCSSEDNSILQAEQAKAAFEAAGYTVTTYTAADSSEVQPVLTKACGAEDALYIPTDNLFAASMQSVSNVTISAGIPVICGEANMARDGGLATDSIDYYRLGQAAGEQAYQILVEGADPATTPIKIFTDDADFELIINEEVAQALNWPVPDSLRPDPAA